MKHPVILEDVHREITRDPVNFRCLRRAIDAYGDLLARVSELELDLSDHRKDLHFDNGKALSTTWAARCLDELQYTRKLIRGIHLAVAERINRKNNQPIHHHPLAQLDLKPEDTLMVSTTIQTYGPVWIHERECSLNPFFAQRVPPEKTQLSLAYSWERRPGYRIDFSYPATQALPITQ